MNLKQWYDNPLNAEGLAELMEHPLFARALSVIESSNTPAFRAGVAPVDLALVHSFQAGVHHVRRALHALSKPPALADSPLGEWEWPTDPTTESTDNP